MFRITRYLPSSQAIMAAVHPQPPQDALPPGWECRYDPRTGRYYFLNHVEHITTWEDPRLRHAEFQQGSYAKYYLYGTGKLPPGPVKSYSPYFGSSSSHSTNIAPPPPPPVVPIPASNTAQIPNQEGNVQVDERILMKLCVQFPTVEESYIWQLLKQYHNRENVVVSALLAEGQPRAQTHSVDLTPKLQRPEAQTFQVDELLYFKLRNFFPAADPDHIRNLQKMYNNQEHEIIAALVAGNRGSRHQSPHPSSPKMKLRYLKLVFPEADEAILFDVLNNCDNNAQEASNRLVGMGYKKRDTPITRPLMSQPFVRPITELSHPSPPERPLIIIPPSASDKIRLVAKLQEQFPAVSRTLVNMALDSSNYNEDRAKQFLSAMTPQDAVRPALPQTEVTTEGSPAKVSFPAEAPPVPPRSRHASASQDSDTGSGSRHSSLDRHPLRAEGSREATPSRSPSHRGSTSSPSHAAIGSPARKISSATATDKTFRQKFKRTILKFSKSTTTHDEHETISKYRTKAKGPDPSLRKGPCEKLLLKEYVPWSGPNPENRKGPDPSLRKGPDPNNRLSNKENRAKGPQRGFCRNALASFTHSLSHCKIFSRITANGSVRQ